MAINVSDDQKFQILKEAYIEQRREISFWRERSWKVTTWLIGLMLAVSGVAIFFNAKYPIILIPLLALSIIATIYLHKNYKVYSERWERLAAVEDALGFFDQNVYVQGKSLHPPELRKPTVTYKGTGFFIAAIWVMAISTALAMLLK
jgi:UDP-N-acetylmuramyl pentapeptide phosphotransferase/UDP-N-acetylglucosamine-1-phosphate transferase